MLSIADTNASLRFRLHSHREYDSVAPIFWAVARAESNLQQYSTSSLEYLLHVILGILESRLQVMLLLVQIGQFLLDILGLLSLPVLHLSR